VNSNPSDQKKKLCPGEQRHARMRSLVKMLGREVLLLGEQYFLGSILSSENSPHFRMIDVGRELSLPSYLFLTSGAGFLGLMLCLPSRHDQIDTEFSESDPDLLIPGIVNPVPSGVLPSAVFNKDGGYALLILSLLKGSETPREL
jgi:hypothetical protein